MIIRCHACRAENEFHGPVGRRDLCIKCDTELRCCLQCKYYAPTAPSECREPQAEVPRDKERSNFCELYSAGDGAGHEASKADLAKAAFDALFSKK